MLESDISPRVAETPNDIEQSEKHALAQSYLDAVSVSIEYHYKSWYNIDILSDQWHSRLLHESRDISIY